MALFCSQSSVGFSRWSDERKTVSYATARSEKVRTVKVVQSVPDPGLSHVVLQLFCSCALLQSNAVCGERLWFRLVLGRVAVAFPAVGRWGNGVRHERVIAGAQKRCVVDKKQDGLARKKRGDLLGQLRGLCGRCSVAE